MPIRPENKARYPKDWLAISAAIRERAGHRCEWEDDGGRCSARQYGVGHWERRRNVFTGSERWCWRPTCGNGPHDCAGAGFRWPSSDRWTFAEAREFASGCNDLIAWCGDQPRLIVIVLTVAHLDHQPENCDPGNLRAWCQRHHLAYDHDHHQATAQATRRVRAGTLEMF